MHRFTTIYFKKTPLTVAKMQILLLENVALENNSIFSTRIYLDLISHFDLPCFYFRPEDKMQSTLSKLILTTRRANERPVPIDIIKK